MFRVSMLPAQDGDCLFVETEGHRLLIDAGRSVTGTTCLQDLLARLPARDGPLVDLLVLTHVDADHVGGVLSILRLPTAPSIGQAWFNGHRQLVAAAAGPARVFGGTPGSGVTSPVLGVRQGIEFGALLDARKIAWNSDFAGGPAMVPDGGRFPRVGLGSEATLVLLGPSRRKLADFLPDWRRAMDRLEASPEPTLRDRVRPVPHPGNLEQIARSLDEADTSKPNGTSIFFVIEWRNRRALFCADAHPDDLAAAVQAYGSCCAGPVRFDLVKVSHHGSARNNTSALTRVLASPLWLVSTDGTRHKHPDPEGISRVVLAPGPGKRICFNYKTQWNEVWADADLQGRFGFTAEFGDGRSAMCFDLA